jgi:membrane protease YdiL (CAAX protease family)
MEKAGETLMNRSQTPIRRTWALLIAGPLLFLAAIVAASVYFGIVTRGDAQAIAEQTSKGVPVMLVAVQLLLLVFLVRTLRSERLAWSAIGWRLEQGQVLWREVLIGVVPGAVLAVLYFTVLSPAMMSLQRNVGDYVPPGELTGALGTALVPFFLANVLLAPFVEESLYRGYALDRLQQRYGMTLAIIISCAFFGLLHWAGGFWYILLTGVVAGGLFAGLRVWRGALVAPFAAHLALNVLEFVWIWLAR